MHSIGVPLSITQKGCIYLHMIREMLSQIFKNTISKLKFLLLNHLVLMLKQFHWMLA